MDLSSFSEVNFNPKEWVNTIFQDKTENKENHASDLLMKLQLFVQEVNNALESTAQQVALNLPRIMKEVESMSEEAKYLKGQMIEIKTKIGKSEHSSIQTIHQLDTLKSRVLEANKALREADNWSTLSAGVDEVFESGDIDAISTKIIALQRCLEILKNVPDYKERCALVEQQKNKLEALITPQIIAAFNSHSLDLTLVYMRIFKDIDRLKNLEKYYHDCHKEQLLSHWNQLVSSDSEETLIEWLNNFLDIVLSTWHNQMVWSAQVFTNPVPILLNLFVDVFHNLEPGLPFCLNAALKIHPSPLDCFVHIKEIIDRFVKSIEISIPKTLNVDVELTAFLQSLYISVRNQMDKYSILEEQYLLANVHWEAEDLQKCIRLLDESVSKLDHIIPDTEDHCTELSQGFGLPGLILAYKEFFSKYLERHRVIVTKIKKEQKEGDQDAWILFQIVMTLLQISGEIMLKIKSVESILVQQALKVQEQLNGLDRDPFQSYENYLLSPPLKKQLKELLIKIESEDLSLLMGNYKSFQQHCNNVRQLLFEVSFHQVESQLKAVPEMEVWKNKGDSAFKSELPSFSTAPQEYVTQIGQYLMTVPQHIEPFVSQDNVALVDALNTDQENVAHSILNHLVKQTVHYYVDAIVQIEDLSQAGAIQLSTDIGYLQDVIEDMSLSCSEHLTLINKLVKVSPEEFPFKTKPAFITSAIKRMRKIM